MTMIDLDSRVGQMIDALSPRDRLVALARVLHREGYDDHTTGHITYRQPDGTFLVNPFELSWDEIRSSDVMRMDAQGNKLDGLHTITPAITLHVEMHRARPGTDVVLHGHPQWATAWACARRIPAVYDQTSATAGRHVALYADYGGTVDAAENARAAVEAMGESGMALLGNHGVFVTAGSVAEAYIRASTLEWRCRRAWQVEALGGGTPLEDHVVDGIADYVRENLRFFPMFEAAIRAELRRDPDMFT